MLRCGDLQEAEVIFSGILQQQPGNPAANCGMGQILMARGQLLPAGDFFQRALVGAPDHAQANFGLAESLRIQGSHAEAAEHYEKALTVMSDDPRVFNHFGMTCMELSRFARARELFEHALVLQPDLAYAHNNLGILLGAHGEIDAARAHFDEALHYAPDLYDAYFHRALFRKFTAVDADIEDMEARIADPAVPDEGRASLGFALGKAYDDLGDCTTAFGYYSTANECQRRLQPFDIDASIDEIESIRQVFEAVELPEIDPDYGTDLIPVFIVGIPRSGSSLIEQILAGHSRVLGAGELELLGSEIRGAGPYFPQSIADFDGKDLERIGTTYLDELQSVAGGTASVVIDKMPANFLYIGLIQVMFPNARIINTLRHPLDCCLSCFQQRFTGTGVAFSNDLDDLGRYYRAYRQLMAYWRARFPDRIIDLRYEDLVARPEETVGGLLDSFGLTFEPSCMEFHRAARPVGTASVAQVRRPIHGDSVQKWQRYEAFLAPLKKHMEDAWLR